MAKYNSNTRAILKPIDKELVQNMESIECNLGYQNLAYAIIKSGYKNNDVGFIQSEWCDTLRYFVSLDIHGFHGNTYVDNKNKNNFN